MMPMKRFCFICNSDSQVYGALHHARHVSKRGHDVHFFILNSNNIPSDLLDGELSNYKRTNFVENYKTIIKTLLPELARFDAIGVFGRGSEIYTAVSMLKHFRSKNPHKCFCIFSGFNGLVYEKFEEGLSWRLGADVICLNSKSDLMAAKKMLCETAFRSQPFVITGVPSVRYTRGAKLSKKLVFAEQNIVPSTEDERLLLAEILNSVAINNPEWSIVIKPRLQPGQNSFHNYQFHVSEIVDRLDFRSKNLLLSYKSLDRELYDARLLASISSTALIGASLSGMPCIALSDFGIKNSYGSHLFVSSGFFFEIDQKTPLETYEDRSANPKWLEYIAGDNYDYDHFLSFIEKHCGTTNQPRIETQKIKKTTRHQQAYQDPNLKYLFPRPISKVPVAVVERKAMAIIAQDVNSRQLVLWILWRRQLLAGLWLRSRRTLDKIIQPKKNTSYYHVFWAAILSGFTKRKTRYAIWVLVKIGAL